MTMADLRKIGSILFKQNNISSSKDRTLLNAQWASLGRGSDIGGITYSDIHWLNGFFSADITRRKVSQLQTLSVFPSALIWEIDMLHSLGVQIITEPFATTTKIFSQLDGNGSSELNVAAYINRVMKVMLLKIDSPF